MKAFVLGLAVAGSLAIGSVMAATMEPPTSVGSVDKIQAVAEAQRAGAVRALAAAAPVYFRDKLRTGAGSRLEAKLADDTVLTLGASTRLTIDEFVYKPGETGGKLALTVAGGPFLFVGGKIEGPTGGNVAIHTPVGTLGVRGTTVWGGPIDKGYGVLVLKGEVSVTTATGTVVLHEGQGTMIRAKQPPQAAAPWPEDRVHRAVATISFAH
jgi:hypothetical protein